MPVFTRHDIDNMGFKAARSLAEGTPLHTSLVKMAKDNSMNPEQIKRLVESANTTAFLNQFKEKTGNQRMVEFDVADPTKVIDSALSGSDESASANPNLSITITVSNGDTSSLHDSVVDENRHSAPESSKVASYEDLEVVKLAREEPALSMSGYNKHKAKDSLLTKLADCNYRASDLADDIARRYRGIYTRDKYAGLELDALSTYGNGALPALQMVRNRLGLSKIANTLSAQQEYILQDRHLVEASDELNKVARIIELCKTHEQVAKSLAHIERM